MTNNSIVSMHFIFFLHFILLAGPLFSQSNRGVLSPKEAFDLLTDPTTSLTYGKACGIVGVDPKGRVAIDNLLEAKRIDLIKEVLYSENVVGKIYAIQVMTKLANSGKVNLNEKDKLIFHEISQSNVLINTCSGCLVYQSTPKEIIGTAWKYNIWK